MRIELSRGISFLHTSNGSYLLWSHDPKNHFPSYVYETVHSVYDHYDSRLLRQSGSVVTRNRTSKRLTIRVDKVDKPPEYLRYLT